jgi:hypothetical protein
MEIAKIRHFSKAKLGGANLLGFLVGLIEKT